MKNIRTFAAVAASVVIAATLVVGLAVPANAATATNFPPTPIQPGPKVPPIPPGTTLFPAVNLPTCGTAVIGYPIDTNFANDIGTLEPALRAIGGPARHIGCTYGTDFRYATVTIVAIGPADFARLTTWYQAHAVSFVDAGGTLPGNSVDKYALVSPGGQEQAVLSPNGWWITMQSNDAFGASIFRSAVQRFTAQNVFRP